MLNLMQPYLNQRTMVLRTQLIDNHTETNSIVGDGVTHTFSEANTSGWWGRALQQIDGLNSGMLYGSRVIKKFKLIEDGATPTTEEDLSNLLNDRINGAYVSFTFTERGTTDVFYNFDFKIKINDTKFKFGNFGGLHESHVNPLSEDRDDGIKWTKEAAVEKTVGSISEYSHQFNMFIPNSVLFFQKNPLANNGKNKDKVKIVLSTYDIPNYNENPNSEIDENEGLEIGDPGYLHTSIGIDDFTIRAGALPGTLITDDEVTHSFEQGNDGWEGGSLADVDDDKFLHGGYGEEVKQTFQYDGDSTNGGIFIKFDFLELNSWDDEDFVVSLNDTEISFKASHVVNETHTKGVGYPNGIVWSKSNGTEPTNFFEGNSGWNDQTHTFRIFVPDDFFDPNAPLLDVGFSSTLDQAIGDESWGIDNFSIKEATSEDIDVMYVLDSQAPTIAAHLQNMSTSSISADKTAGVWTEIKTKLDASTGLEGHVNLIYANLFGKSLDILANDAVYNLGNQAKDTTATWFDGETGFHTWAEKLWDKTAEETANEDTTMQNLALGVSILAAAAGSLTPGIGTAVGILGIGTGINGVLAAQRDDLPELTGALSGFSMVDVFNEIYIELLDRGYDELATELKTNADAGNDMYENLVANAQLVSIFADLDNSRQSEPTSIDDLAKAEEIEALGFNVTNAYDRTIDFGIIGSDDIYRVTVTSGDNNLRTDSLYYEYVVSDYGSNKGIALVDDIYVA